MPPRKTTKREQVARYLAEKQSSRVGEDEWRELLDLLAPISESYLRGLLRASGAPLDPVVEGLRQDSFADLERTLVNLADEYVRASGAGERDRAARCRDAVLTGKDHARLAARRRGAPAELKAQKEEMASWMLLWLENPAIFPSWAALRGKAPRSARE